MRAFSILELVFSILILGIAFMVIPSIYKSVNAGVSLIKEQDDLSYLAGLVHRFIDEGNINAKAFFENRGLKVQCQQGANLERLTANDFCKVSLGEGEDLLAFHFMYSPKSQTSHKLGVITNE